MKKISIFLVVAFFLFGATLPAISEENNQNFLGINPEDVSVLVLEAPFEPEGQLGTLDYDITECTNTPWNSPPQHTVSGPLCGCVQMNLGVDMTSAPSPITVTPTWGLYYAPWNYWWTHTASPVNLNPGARWYIILRVRNISGFTGPNPWWYAAGADYLGTWYWNPVAYQVDFNCP